MAHRRAFIPFALAVTLLLALFPTQSVHAAIFTVNNTADTVDANPGNGVCADAIGICTLRAAIMEANAYPGADIINVRAGTYTLTIAGREENNAATGDLDILEPVTIIGSNGSADADPALTIIQAGSDPNNGIDKVFSVNPNLDLTFNTTFRALTIRHGYNTSADAVHGYGGGLDWNAGGTGRLTLYNCMITDNTAVHFGGGGLSARNSGPAPSGQLVTITRTVFSNNRTLYGDGGGLAIEANVPFAMTDSTIRNNSAHTDAVADFGRGGGMVYSGTAGVNSTITGSTFSGNQALGRDANTDNGAGGAIFANGPLEISNTTISGNTATGSGGGAMLVGATLTNVTITENRCRASGFADGSGGGIDTANSNNTVLRNTIVAGNLCGDTASSLSGTYHTGSSFNNLIGTGEAGGFVNGSNDNLVGVADARLGPLADNGGRTQTHALLPGSPALDAGSSTYSPGPTDQRGTGFTRPMDAADADLVKAIDIGAFEAYTMIEDLPDRTIAVNTTLNDEFNFGDPALGSPSFTFASTNTALVPVANVAALSGSTGKRTLVVDPVKNQSGVSTITVTMKLVEKTVSDSFVLSVVAYPDFVVTKTHTGNFYQGQSGASFTITTANQGLGASTGAVTVTDTLPSGLTATAISGAGWDCSLGTLTCTRSDALAANSSYPPVTLTVDVGSSAPASLTNQVSVSNALDSNTGNNTASDGVTIDAIPDLAVTKTHTGNFHQGQKGATYTLTVSNQGSGPTSGVVTLTDTLPAGLVATAISGAGWECSLSTLTCTRSTVLDASASYPALTLTVDVAANAPATLTNTAQVSGGGDILTGNNTASDPTTVEQLADLTVSKSHSGDFQQGQQNAAYILVVTNIGGGPTIGTVTLNDVLPVGLSAVDLSGEGWVCDLPTMSCTRADALDGGASYPPVTLLVGVENYAAPLVTNTATVSGGEELNTSNNSAEDPTHIIQMPDLQVSKSHSGDFTQGQEGAVFTLSVRNEGMGSTSGTVTLTDTLPSGLTATAMSGAGWNCTPDTTTCTRADALAGSGSYPPVTLTVKISPTAPAGLTNSASVAAANDINPENNSAGDDVVILPAADLVVSKTHTGTFRQGQRGAVYTMTVSNIGAGATNAPVSVTDMLPPKLTATGLSGAGWNCDLGSRSCTRADSLAAGDSFPPVLLEVDVSADAPAELVNTAQVLGGGEAVTGNNTASDLTVIDQAADLGVVIQHSGDFRQGQPNAPYELTVSNGGAGPTVGTVSIRVTLPPGLQGAAMTGSGWECELAALTCTRSDALAAGASYPVIQLAVNVADDAPPAVLNTASVSGGGELETANNTAADPTSIIQVADLTVAKTHSGDFKQAQPGAEFILIVTNSGPGATVGEVTLSDTLPLDLTAVEMSGEGWTCALDSLTCTRSDVLAAGASYPPVTLNVDVSDQAGAEMTNQAQVQGGGELNIANNGATDEVHVTPLPDLAVLVTSAASFEQGQTGAQYVIQVTNAGNAPTNSTVSVTDTLPAGLTATDLSGEGWNCTLASLTCQRLDSLEKGGSYPHIFLTVDVAADAGESLTNTAVISGGDELTLDNNSFNRLTPVMQRADLTLSKTHTGAFRQGQSGAVYSLTVTNAGRGATSGAVLLEELLPAGLAATDLAGDGWACDLTALTCTRADVLAAGGSYPVVTVKVDVAEDAPNTLVNRARVSGGGELINENSTAEDSTAIHTRPVITLHPQSQSIWQGQVAVLTAAAGGDPLPEVQWQTSSDEGETWSDLTGETGTALTFTMMPEWAEVLYRAVFTNEVGSAATDAARLTLNYPPQFGSQEHSRIARAGQRVMLNVVVTARPEAEIHWQISSDEGETWSDIAGANGAEYTFRAELEMDGYRFRAVAVNEGGFAVSEPILLTVGQNHLYFPLLWRAGR